MLLVIFQIVMMNYHQMKRVEKHNLYEFIKNKKIISRSTYDKKKKEFTIVFKEPAVAQLVQLMMPAGKRTE
jgi:hypothetical protein